MFRNKITVLLQFVKKVHNEHDISELNLGINRTQTKILMLINDNNEKSMSEISSMTGLEKSSFTRSIDYLVDNRFVEKNFTESDRRIIKLSLTKKGIKAANLIKNDFDSYLDSLISDFSEEEKKDFFNSLNTVSEYLNKLLERKKR
ncbi:MAG TPA: MarR family transcriptional regulator [Spirochaetota bacterium]|nr:MarR family transcriptional regulator [Spirochaetota bacterium]HPJ34539.1 MarR family transcriptional regulator [Spirochaetota bacterium]